MNKQISLQPEYSIVINRKIFGILNLKSNIVMYTSVSDFESLSDTSYTYLRSIEVFTVLGIKIDRILSCARLTMHSKYAKTHIFIYSCSFNDTIFQIVDIKDIVVTPKYRSKGIGTNLLNLIEDISTDNSIQYITGILEKYNDLESRKKFYEKNGYTLLSNSKIGMSGIAVVKDLR